MCGLQKGRNTLSQIHIWCPLRMAAPRLTWLSGALELNAGRRVHQLARRHLCPRVDCMHHESRQLCCKTDASMAAETFLRIDSREANFCLSRTSDFRNREENAFCP